MDAESTIYAISRGERDVFDGLYRKMQPIFIRYATGLLAGDRDTAEDIVDEAFIAIWQTASTYHSEGSATGWMRRIVRNKAVDWLRKRREATLSCLDQINALHQIPDTSPSPYTIAENTSQTDHMRAALNRLTMNHREVIWLCYFEEKSIAQIAKITGCPQNTVKTRLYHARIAMRDLVDA
jgi:RNA polymerase sigma-70 factor, ECF subfamily